ncbi:hypothetical protein CPB83DRAFT_857280 [Crepidotus variabilis]|uniref:Uncharacterized protein n=1 Tax=Crepidotus variabilis TaxID=179855 RepID=A0A9P6ECB9_9AGAR|nr:hypothetical protein CPB83DRAFT_857280 [Crepidotus variabilis]
MRFFTSATAVFAFVCATTATPVPGKVKSVSDVTKRGNGDEIVYLVTCNGEPHASRAVYYAHWHDSQTYRAHAPDAISYGNGNLGLGGYSSPGSTQYIFLNTKLDVTLNNLNPGWYQVAGSAINQFGTSFICRMDNGHQLYSDCFSNYYCQ